MAGEKPYQSTLRLSAVAGATAPSSPRPARAQAALKAGSIDSSMYLQKETQWFVPNVHRRHTYDASLEARDHGKRIGVTT